MGAHFGVVLVRDDFAQVEVATFRSDHDYADGRRPDSVHFETIRSRTYCAATSPSTACCSIPKPDEVLDFVAGRADLEKRVIRAIGDPIARFREDHLRLLRAVRFAARLRFSIDAATLAAIQQDHALIATVSAERMRDELARILTEGGARRGFELLDETGLLAEILPEVAAMKGVEQPPQYHPEGDVWVHTLLLLEGMHRPTPRWRWVPCCTMSASRPRSASPTAFGSTGTWKPASNWPTRSSRACVFPTMRSSRWRRW